MNKLWLLLLLAFTMESCVSMKKFEDVEALAAKYRGDNADALNDLSDSQIALEDLTTKTNADIAALNDEIKSLNEQNNVLANSLKEYQGLNENLTTQQKDLISYSSAEQDRLLKELAAKEKELSAKEAELNQLQESLMKRETSVNQLQKELMSKSARIDELEKNLNAKDEAINDLKNNMKNALKGFTLDELTVVEKDGKIYVSLSENLLFKSGSFDIDTKGKDALVKIAEVLKVQKDVDIVVEGHADNVPYNGSGQLKDNLDLSAKRATTVTRILLENGVPTDNLVAAGRGDAKPVASNDDAEGRAKNRRTEIILAPQLDKLFKILEGE